MIRKIKYLTIFLTTSLVLGNITYQSLVDAKHIEAVTMFWIWSIASFLVYAVYVGWIQTGASVVRRGRYSMKTGHTPTRDEEITHQFAYFFQNIDSIVRTKDIEE